MAHFAGKNGDCCSPNSNRVCVLGHKYKCFMSFSKSPSSSGEIDSESGPKKALRFYYNKSACRPLGIFHTGLNSEGFDTIEAGKIATKILHNTNRRNFVKHLFSLFGRILPPQQVAQIQTGSSCAVK